MNPLADELRAVVKGEVLDSPEALERASRDASLFRVVPEVVVQPRDANDLCTLVRFATEQKKAGRHISLTARSAGTDMSGGPLGDSIIVDMTAHFTRTLEVGEGYAIVEPGVYFRDFDAKTAEKGLELPSYTASRRINTVGGMVGNDSGGEKNLKYGKTARYVEELEVVLADGKTHTLRALEGKALGNKLREESFEGELYRKVAALLQEHRSEIEQAKPVVSKNSSGYALWDIGDGSSRLDLARLMVGSQGTLGIVTKMRFKLVRPKPYSSMLIIFLRDLADLRELVPAALTHGPDSFESYDDKTFSLAIRYFPEFAAQLKSGVLGLFLSFLPELWMLLRGGVPKLVLLIEFRAETQAEAFNATKRLQTDIEKLGLHEAMRISPDERHSGKYWAIRRESFNLLRKKVRGMRTAPFIDDFVVPPSSLPEFLPKLQEILSRYDLTYTVAGHVGDGNFHIIPLIDPKRDGIAELIEKLSHEVYELVLSFHGSITGEHNDGLVRTPWVPKMFGPVMLSLFVDVKNMFDPLGIFNPGKKVGTTFAQAQAHLDL